MDDFVQLSSDLSSPFSRILLMNEIDQIGFAIVAPESGHAYLT